MDKRYQRLLLIRVMPIVIVVTIPILVGYLLDLHKMEQRKSQVLVQYNSLSLQYQKQAKQVESQKKKRESYRALEKDWYQKSQYFSQILTLTEIIDQFNQLAQLTHLKFSAITPGNVRLNTDPKTIAVSFVTQGSYYNLSNLMAEIAQLPWLIRVDNWSMGYKSGFFSSVEKDNTLELSMTLTIIFCGKVCL